MQITLPDTCCTCRSSAGEDAHFWDEDTVPMVHTAFHAQVEKTPDAVAVVDDTISLTYAELNHRVLLLAEYLRSRGAGPGKMVGIHLPPSIDYVVAMLAISSAGAAYVAIEVA